MEYITDTRLKTVNYSVFIFILDYIINNLVKYAEIGDKRLIRPHPPV